MESRLIKPVLGVLLAVALLGSAGCNGAGASRSQSSTSSSGGQSAVAPGVPAGAPTPDGFGAKAVTTTDQLASGDSAAGKQANADKLVITTASMNLRVDDMSASVDKIRALAAANGGSVTDLQITSNSEAPAAASGPEASSAKVAGPANGSLTLRVPAQKLPAVESQAGTLGTVTSQTSNESDVTQQHIDMAARLNNLRAEEARLRALLRRAGSVSELLQVERELSRVRGDIESMQAQLAYLERQAAMATLTIALDQPGPIVRPSAGGWGLGSAVTEGLQAAFVLVKGLITLLVALSPVIVLALLAWWLIAWSIRRRRARRAAALESQPSGHDDPIGHPASDDSPADNQTR